MSNTTKKVLFQGDRVKLKTGETGTLVTYSDNVGSVQLDSGRMSKQHLNDLTAV